MEPNITPNIGNQIKFTVEENSSLQSIKDRYQENIINFGRLYLERKELDSIEKSLLKEKETIESDEKSFLQSIISKYGEGTFDPKTGIFTPKEQKN